MGQTHDADFFNALTFISKWIIWRRVVTFANFLRFDKLAASAKLSSGEIMATEIHSSGDKNIE